MNDLQYSNVDLSLISLNCRHLKKLGWWFESIGIQLCMLIEGNNITIPTVYPFIPHSKKKKKKNLDLGGNCGSKKMHKRPTICEWPFHIPY